MRLLPYHVVILDIAHSPAEVAATLRTWVKGASSPDASDSAKPFEGSIKRPSFTISRTIGYRNAFIANLFGTLQTTGSGTRLRVRFMPSPIVIATTILWALGIIAISAKTISENGPSLVWIAMPLVMLAAGYAMTMGGFWYEAPKAEQLLIAAIADMKREEPTAIEPSGSGEF
jgi:hypothetical protein